MIARQGRCECLSLSSDGRRRAASEMISSARVAAKKVRRSRSNSSNESPATNSRASSPLSRMSNSAWRALLESIHGFPFGGRPNVRFQMAAVCDIDPAREQVAKILRNGDIFPQSDRRVRSDLDQNVDVAVRPIVAASARAEQRGVSDAPRAQSRLVFLQSADDRLPIHDFNATTKSAQITDGWSRRGPRLVDFGSPPAAADRLGRQARDLARLPLPEQPDRKQNPDRDHNDAQQPLVDALEHEGARPAAERGADGGDSGLDPVNVAG